MRAALALLLASSLAFAEPPTDAPLDPHVVLLPNGHMDLDGDAQKALKRDRDAWKAQLRDAQIQRVGVLVGVGVGGLALGVVLGLVLPPLIRPAK